MCSLPAFSGPSGMRTVRGKPAPRLGGLQGKCVLRGACLQKEQEGDASLRGGGNDTGGFAEGRLCFLEGEVGAYLEMKKQGVRTERGIRGALWRIKCRF